jgi:hypothetical protein
MAEETPTPIAEKEDSQQDQCRDADIETPQTAWTVVKRGPGRPKKDRSADPPPPPKRPVGRPKKDRPPAIVTIPTPPMRQVRVSEWPSPPPQPTRSPVELLVEALKEQKRQARDAKTAMYKSFVFK